MSRFRTTRVESSSTRDGSSRMRACPTPEHHGLPNPKRMLARRPLIRTSFGSDSPTQELSVRPAGASSSGYLTRQRSRLVGSCSNTRSRLVPDTAPSPSGVTNVVRNGRCSIRRTGTRWGAGSLQSSRWAESISAPRPCFARIHATRRAAPFPSSCGIRHSAGPVLHPADLPRYSSGFFFWGNFIFWIRKTAFVREERRRQGGACSAASGPSRRSTSRPRARSRACTHRAHACC